MFDEYDEEPVFYCKHCLSLGILSLGEQPYCRDCGDTDIAEVNIFDWKKMYKDKYGEDFVNEPIED